MAEYEDVFFKLVGLIGRNKASATWSNGFLMADQELLERADVLVGLGETFAVEGHATPVMAGLAEPLAAALTLIRSFDRLTESRMSLGFEHHDDAARLAVKFQNVASTNIAKAY